MLRLVVTHGNEEQVFAVPEGEAHLGSAPENDLVVRAPGVSRRHALVRPSPGGVEVVDLGSKNGLVAQDRRVTRAILTPGLWLQIGAAWFGVEEISASEESLAFMLHPPSTRAAHPPFTTATLGSEGDLTSRSPADIALALACQIVETGAGLPGARADLLVRIKDTLGAEAFASFERTRRGKLLLWEGIGEFLPEDMGLLGSLAADVRSSARELVVLTRKGRLLLAGREAWFLAAKFPEESLTREGWRKDLLRFLMHQFFLPVRSLDDLTSSEASRVLALAKGNKKKAALLLGVSRGTLYNLLTRRSTPKP
ncbi:MAG TPA: FHA domain-containing protein [Thermoanaerobaculia bacterium]|nr:FHA domain-containing protein [Thermoanaerobaculia bacterium]